jgi:hypothetical protein
MHCLRDDAGTVFVEYVVVLSLVGLGATTVVVGLGAALVMFFQAQQAILALPIP